VARPDLLVAADALAAFTTLVALTALVVLTALAGTLARGVDPLVDTLRVRVDAAGRETAVFFGLPLVDEAAGGFDRAGAALRRRTGPPPERPTGPRTGSRTSPV
jgi:hypothetical protein